MHDTAIKNFCIAARRDLMAEVALRAARFGIREDGYEPPAADVIDGRPLSVEERRQRAELIRRLGPADGPSYREAYENLVDEAAYTWFNRLVAIRFMELNDRLPSHVRMLSAEDGAFAPQVLREALDVAIGGVDAATVARLVSESEDEALFRYLFLAQCRELSACLPDVFEPVGAAMELLLPEGLLRQGGVVQRLVDDIPEADWTDGVEIVGWMYQYYVSERKDEVFASFKKGKKADATALAPATQLFTPDWIVQYLTQNSLGRLWMQAHPESTLPSQMSYYIPDDLGTENTPGAPARPTSVGDGFSRPAHPASTPESITVIDPACGSGHILVYAFRLLAAMYEEAGYGRRDIPRLILQNNLTGCEIDPRAAQIASFALAMTACEWDSRFLRRDEKVRARIVCLRPAELTEDELEEMPYLAKRAALLDAMAHMGECGSLFVPEPEDIAALQQADDELDAREAGGDLLAHHPRAMVARMLANCEPLAETYDAVIANPPYMGSSNMDKWLANWTKKHYPDSKRDLCTCFIERGFTLAKPEGYNSMVTTQSWMFLSNAETLRGNLLREGTIITLADTKSTGYHADNFTANAAFVLRNSVDSTYSGSYFKLEQREGQKEKALREAIANPSCGWFYRRSSDSFRSIPGTPIAYWGSLSAFNSFRMGESGSFVANFVQGLKPAPVEKFVLPWREVSARSIWLGTKSPQREDFASYKWYFVSNGGDYRKWAGNQEDVVNWLGNGEAIKAEVDERGKCRARVQNERFYFENGLTWSALTSGLLSVRVHKGNGICCGAGYFIMPNISTEYLLGFLNSSTAQYLKQLLSQTMNNEVGDLSRLPVVYCSEKQGEVEKLANLVMELSVADYDAFETSIGFVKHCMV